MNCKLIKMFSLIVVVCSLSLWGQYNRQIPAKICTISPDTAQCFSSSTSRSITVQENISFFESIFKYCLGSGSTSTAFKPIRVILAIDNSGSMCQCEWGCNDSTDQRIRAAHLFVDSLARRSPNSEVGIERFGGSASDHRELSPLPLNNNVNIETIHDRIKDAACDPGGDAYVYKRLKTTETYQGLATNRALKLVDENYNQIKDSLTRHIIMLTDDGWMINNDVFPDSIINEYRRDFPGRVLPVVNTVFLSITTTSTDVNLQAIADSTGGTFRADATPATIVQNFLDILETISVTTTENLQSFTITDISDGTSKSASISKLSGTGNEWLALSSGLFILNNTVNTFAIRTVVSGTERLDTLTITRSASGSSTINGYEINCTPDMLHMSITATPVDLVVDMATTVTAKIDPSEADRFAPGEISLRALTPFNAGDAHTLLLLHLDNNTTKAAGSGTVTGAPTFTTTGGAFYGGVSGGSFTMEVGALAADFTMECWVNFDQATNNSIIFQASDFTFGLSDGKLYFATGTDTIRSSITVDKGVWQHVAVSREGTAINLFVNGLQESESITAATAFSGTIQVGTVTGYTLDEVRIRSAREIETIGRDTFLKIPSSSTITWDIGGTITSGKTVNLPATLWSNGSCNFTYSSSVLSGTIVNLVHTGPDNILWSKTGVPVKFKESGLPAIATVYDTSGDGHIDRIDIKLDNNEQFIDNLPAVDALINSITITTADGSKKELHPIAVEKVDGSTIRLILQENTDADLETGWQEITWDIAPEEVTTKGIPFYIRETVDAVGPVVSQVVVYAGWGDESDTLRIKLSEPISCEKLLSMKPEDAFRYYSETSGLTGDALKDAIFGMDCPTGQFVQTITIITENPDFNFVPFKDSIQLVGNADDQAGNYPPDPSIAHKAPVKPGGENVIQAAPIGQPFIPGVTTIEVAIPDKKIRDFYQDVIGSNNYGTIISIQTKIPLKKQPDNSYGTAYIYDVVGNIVRDDLRIGGTQSLNDYGVLWDGRNKNDRLVGAGTYLLIVDAEDVDNKKISKRVKIGVKK